MRPQAAKEVEYDEGFTDGAEEGADCCEAEEAGEKEVVGWPEAVENDGYMGEQFTDDVECTCHHSSQQWLSIDYGRPQYVPLSTQ